MIDDFDIWNPPPLIGPLARRPGRPRVGEERLPPDEEWADLLKHFGSFGAMARHFGASKSSVSARARRMGLRSPKSRIARLVCAICGADRTEARVLRFGLQVTVQGPSHQRYSGSLDLCGACWGKYVKRRPRRRVCTALVAA